MANHRHHAASTRLCATVMAFCPDRLVVLRHGLDLLPEHAALRVPLVDRDLEPFSMVTPISPSDPVCAPASPILIVASDFWQPASTTPITRAAVRERIRGSLRTSLSMSPAPAGSTLKNLYLEGRRQACLPALTHFAAVPLAALCEKNRYAKKVRHPERRRARRLSIR